MIKLVHHEMLINSKFLEVPRSYYQRHLNANRVKRIATEFDERIANAPKVSYRNGHYYVFDGQHGSQNFVAAAVPPTAFSTGVN